MSALTTLTTVEFVINAGTGARVRLEPYPAGVPYIIVDDGTTEATIKPAEDEGTLPAIAFADELIETAVQYATALLTAQLPLVPPPSENPAPVQHALRSAAHRPGRRGVSSTTFEFTINTGIGVRAHLDRHSLELPCIVIEDGPIGMIIKPADGEVTDSTIMFADEFVKVARAYKAGLVDAHARPTGS